MGFCRNITLSKDIFVKTLMPSCPEPKLIGSNFIISPLVITLNIVFLKAYK